MRRFRQVETQEPIIFMGTLLISMLFASFMSVSSNNPSVAISSVNNQNEVFLSSSPDSVVSLPTLPKKEKNVKQMWVTITAYSSDPEQTDSTPFITASGEHVRDGIIAANFLDFGTNVTIPELFGEKIFTVEDRLHARFSDRIDIWMPTKEDAKQFGRQYALLEIEL